MPLRQNAVTFRSLYARAFAVALAFALLLATLHPSQAADLAPKRILMLQSFGLGFKPWTDYANTFRSEMSRQSKDALDFQDHSLLTARLDDDNALVPFVDYLHALYGAKPP